MNQDEHTFRNSQGDIIKLTEMRPFELIWTYKMQLFFFAFAYVIYLVLLHDMFLVGEWIADSLNQVVSCAVFFIIFFFDELFKCHFIFCILWVVLCHQSTTTPVPVTCGCGISTINNCAAGKFCFSDKCHVGPKPIPSITSKTKISVPWNVPVLDVALLNCGLFFYCLFFHFFDNWRTFPAPINVLCSLNHLHESTTPIYKGHNFTRSVYVF